MLAIFTGLLIARDFFRLCLASNLVTNHTTDAPKLLWNVAFRESARNQLSYWTTCNASCMSHWPLERNLRVISSHRDENMGEKYAILILWCYKFYCNQECLLAFLHTQIIVIVSNHNFCNTRIDWSQLSLWSQGTSSLRLVQVSVWWLRSSLGLGYSAWYKFFVL